MKARSIKYSVTDNGCWVCTSHKPNSSGYPVKAIGGKHFYIHRLMYEKYKGKIKSEVLRHTCDNTLCINPAHLKEGSHIENVQDRVDRNRSARGTKNGRSKLSEATVLAIFNDDITSKMELARIYNVDAKVIREIKQGKIWKSVTGLTRSLPSPPL